MNRLYYGNNFQVLREHIADESVDLIYLDPRGEIEAFEDTLHCDRASSRPAV
jgi:site-specific DNA-methyltransferase (adenine-specific)